jgi:NADPH-dependent glutamate synthase beta subunit-like oxidoreductase
MGAGGEKKFRVHKNREQIILGGLDTAIRCAANKNASYGSSAHARICYLLREKLLSH